MTSLIESLNELKNEIDKKSAELDDLKERYNYLNTYIVDLFLCEEIERLTVKEGTFYLNKQFFVSPREERKEVVDWLKENAKWLIKEDYNGNAFNRYIRETIERGDEVPDCVKLFTKISIRRRTK